MEFLRKVKIIICFLFVGFLVHGQSFETDHKAFKSSYEKENEGDLSGAINALKAVYSEDSYEINLRLGWLNYQLGKFTESEANYNRALILKPYSEEARFGLINPKAAMGKWNDVIRIYEQILEAHPASTYANYRLGLILFNQKNYEKALVYFQKVVDMYPFTYDSLIMQAWCKYYLGNTREAKILFQKCLLNSPDDKSAKEGLSLIK